MESSEREEDTVTAVKESLKTENSSTAANTDRNEGAGSPPPNCSICLGKLINTSFTDSCLHQFCFTCLLQWSRIKTECPLCKQTFKSIIHNVRSEEDYDQYHVPRDCGPQTIELNFALARTPMGYGLAPFGFRTTLSPHRRYELFINSNVRHAERGIPPSEQGAHRSSAHRRPGMTDPTRPASSRRHYSAEYFQNHPEELDRLTPWINRDIRQFLGNNWQDSDALRIILDLIKQYNMDSLSFRRALLPFFNIHTDNIIAELIRFTLSDLSMAAYDNIYHHDLTRAYWGRVQSPSSDSSLSSSGSEIRVVDRIGRINTSIPRIIPFICNEPGPSTISQTFHATPQNRSPYVMTISSDSSDSECEIVGYVKPRHERTPEIIELASSDEGVTANASTHTRRSSPESSPDIRVGDDNIESDRQRTSIHRGSSKHTEKSRTSRSTVRGIITPISTSSSTSSPLSSSESDVLDRRYRRSRIRIKFTTDSSNNSDEDATANSYGVRVRKDLMKDKSDTSSNASRSTSTTSSSSSSSSSSSRTRTTSSSSSSSRRSSSNSSSISSSPQPQRLRNRKRSRKSSRSTGNSLNSSDKNHKRSASKKIKSTSAKYRKVTTLLRKDVNKKEWYIDRSSSRSRSQSRSSYDSPVRSRRHSQTGDHRRRKITRKSTTEKSSSKHCISSSDSRERSRSNSRNSTSSDKRKSKSGKNHAKDKREVRPSVRESSQSTAGPSGDSSKHSDGKNHSKSRNGDYKNHKDTKYKQSKSKRRLSSDDSSGQTRRYSLRHQKSHRTRTSPSSSASSC